MSAEPNLTVFTYTCQKKRAKPENKLRTTLDLTSESKGKNKIVGPIKSLKEKKILNSEKKLYTIISRSTMKLPQQSQPLANMTPEQQQQERKLRRIRSLQFQPASSLPMTLFMLWMVGNDISIFTIMFVGMSIMNPINALLNTGKVFVMFDNDPTVRKDVTLAKLIHAACCILALGVGLMKLTWMGLLPVSAIDWMDHAPPKYAELSFASF